MKKILSLLLGLVISTLVISTVFYIGVSLFYSKYFAYGTYINGIYATGRDIQSVNKELCSLYQGKCLEIKTYNGNEESISLDDIDFEISYISDLSKVFASQNSWKWPLYLINNRNETVVPDISINEIKLMDAIEDLDILKTYSQSKERNVSILYDMYTGYYLSENVEDYLYAEEIYKTVSASVYDDLNTYLDESYFHEYVLGDRDIKTRETWNELSKFLDCKISLNMGDETIPIDGAVLSKFIDFDKKNVEIRKDAEGNIIVSKDKVDSFVDDLCNSYDTYMYPRDYVTYNGESKHIVRSTYGTLINRKDLKERLYNGITENLNDTIEPKYIFEPFHKGLNDIGPTFVEVDLTNQVFYYVVDGKLLMQYDIVSGKPTGGNATPEVVCYVYKKDRDVFLKGDDYISFVNYWIPFYKADGFHDASWQRDFGGERYINYGSHGCINMRFNDVKAFYEAVEVGTPVIIYK